MISTFLFIIGIFILSWITIEIIGDVIGKIICDLMIYNLKIKGGENNDK